MSESKTKGYAKCILGGEDITQNLIEFEVEYSDEEVAKCEFSFYDRERKWFEKLINQKLKEDEEIEVDLRAGWRKGEEKRIFKGLIYSLEIDISKPFLVRARAYHQAGNLARVVPLQIYRNMKYEDIFNDLSEKFKLGVKFEFEKDRKVDTVSIHTSIWKFLKFVARDLNCKIVQEAGSLIRITPSPNQIIEIKEDEIVSGSIEFQIPKVIEKYRLATEERVAQEKGKLGKPERVIIKFIDPLAGKRKRSEDVKRYEDNIFPYEVSLTTRGMIERNGHVINNNFKVKLFGKEYEIRAVRHRFPPLLTEFELVKK